MSGNDVCLKCGAPLKDTGPDRSCPRCLLAAGLAESDGGAAAGSPDVPTPEELAPHFPQLEIQGLIG